MDLMKCFKMKEKVFLIREVWFCDVFGEGRCVVIRVCCWFLIWIFLMLIMIWFVSRLMFVWLVKVGRFLFVVVLWSLGGFMWIYWILVSIGFCFFW